MFVGFLASNHSFMIYHVDCDAALFFGRYETGYRHFYPSGCFADSHVLYCITEHLFDIVLVIVS